MTKIAIGISDPDFKDQILNSQKMVYLILGHPVLWHDITIILDKNPPMICRVKNPDGHTGKCINPLDVGETINNPTKMKIGNKP